MARSTRKKTVSKKSSTMDMPMMSEMMSSTPASYTPTMPRMKMSPRFLTMAVIVVAIALATYKFGPWMVPAIVGGKPITRIAIWNRLEQTYGAQALDDMVNEVTLDRAIAESGITVEQSAIDEQMNTLNEQFESLGGLDEALKQRGLTRAELEKQVRTQLSVEKILADKVAVSDEEIQAEYDANKETLYQDQEFDVVKDSIATSLKDGKLRDAFLTWFAEVKAEAKIKNFGL